MLKRASPTKEGPNEGKKIAAPAEPRLDASAAAPSLRELLARAERLALAGEDAEATALFDDIVERAAREKAIKAAADALDWLSWLALVELDGDRARAVAERIRRLALPATSREAFRLHVSRATQTLQLGDAATAAAILEDAEHHSRDADIESFTSYLALKADVFCSLGQPEEALGYARLAADIMAKRADPQLRWRRQLYLAHCLHAASRLGESYKAYVVAEELARAAELTWEVPFTQARAAWIALLLGRVSQAREMSAACFESRCSQRWMTVTRSWVGIFVGLACSDDELVAKAADFESLQVALRCADYYSIGPAVAAFHAYLQHAGREAEGQTLLETGIARLPSPDCGWALFAAVAGHGPPLAVERAEMLLAKFPREHRFAEAHRRLFAAIIAARRGAQAESERCAGEAQLLFEDIECRFYAARCLEVAGRLSEAHRCYVAMGATGDARRVAHARGRRGRPSRAYEASRERREILRLLLDGQTSVAIAQRLGVSARTIKKRIADIYDAEGVTTRAELRARKRGHELGE